MAYSHAQTKQQVLLDIGDRGTNAIFELVFPVESVSGTWTFGLGGITSAALNRVYTPDQLPTLQTAIGAVATIGSGNVRASYAAAGYLIEFVGTLGSRPIPPPTVSGALLSPTGEIAVTVKQEGAAPFFGGDITRQWERHDNIADLRKRFLTVRCDVMTEFLSMLQMQFDQKTGDVQRSYSQQFKQASLLMARFESELNNHVPSTANAPSRATAICTQPTATTPNGEVMWQMRPDGRGGLR